MLPPGLFPANALSDIPSTLRYAAQQNLDMPAIVGMDLATQPGIVGDMQKYTLPMSYVNGSAAVTVGNVLSATVNVTTVAGGNALLITGAQPATMVLHRGHPCSVTLGGGKVWTATVLGIVNTNSNQTIVLDGPGAPVSVSGLAGQSLNVGVRLTSADQGKMIWAEGTFGQIHGPFRGIIGTVTGPNTFNLATALASGDSAPNGVAMRMAYGTDNYTALVAAINAAVQASIKIVRVTAPIMSSKYPSAIDRVMLRGEFPLFVPGPNFDIYGSTDSSPMSQILKPVISDAAPEPQPPEPTLRGEELFATMAGVSSPIVAFVGASTFTSDPGPAGMQGAPVRLMRDRLQARNMGRKNISFVELAEGAQNIYNYAGQQTRNGIANWDASYSVPWIGQPSNPGYLYEAAPHHLFIESSANDFVGLLAMTGIIQIHAMMNSWASPPTVTWVTDANKDIGDTNINQSWLDHNMKWIDGWCKVNGYGHISIRREYVKARDGFDPMLDYMMYAPPQPTGSLNNGTTILYGGPTKAFCVGFTFAGTAAQFWSAVNNQIGFTLGDINDGENFAYTPLFRIGYDPTGAFPGGHADQIYYQVDIANSIPGMGLPNTCKPTVLGGYTMTAGSNVLTYAPADGGPATIFASGDNGKILTVPLAGDTATTQSVVGACGYVTSIFVGTPIPAPLVGYMQYISGTEVKLFQDSGLTIPLNAINAISASAPQFVMRGSPRVYPGISGIASDIKTATTFRVWSMDDEVGFWWQGRDDKSVRSVAVKPSTATNPLICIAGTGLGSRLTITVNDGVLPDFWIGDVVVCKQTAAEDEFLGSGAGSEAFAINGVTYGQFGLYGGTAENHPASRVNRIWQRALNAVDWRAPT